MLLALVLAEEQGDIATSIGDGPRVEGQAGSLVLALTGGPTAIIELSGEGAAVLASRQ